MVDDFEWTLPDEESKGSLKLIAAVDISYAKKNNQNAVAALIICEYPSFKVLYEDYETDTTEYPYVPGFLAFKEVPSLTILFERLRANNPELEPDVLLVDGNGILHTRGFGAASHIGVVMGLPSIGVGKTVFAVDGLTKRNVNDLHHENNVNALDTVNLVGDSGTVWGAAMKPTEDSEKPIIISQGHRISLETAIEVVKLCIKFRIPEPIRIADVRSRERVKIEFEGYNPKHHHGPKKKEKKQKPKPKAKKFDADGFEIVE